MSLKLTAKDFLNPEKVLEIRRFLHANHDHIPNELFEPMAFLAKVFMSDPTLSSELSAPLSLNCKIPDNVEPLFFNLILQHGDKISQNAFSEISNYFIKQSPRADFLRSSVRDRNSQAMPLSFKRKSINWLPRCLILCRRFWGGPNTRLHDIGPRVANGLRNGGWKTELLDPVLDGDKEILAYKIDTVAYDVILVDISYVQAAIPDPQRFLLLERLRSQNCPMVLTLFDPWAENEYMAPVVFKDFCDFIWYAAPGTPVRKYSHLPDDRHILLPFPVGVEGMFPIPKINKRDLTPQFVGSISPFNGQRVFWYAALKSRKERFRFIRTMHGKDDLEVEESLYRYFSILAESSVSLNFTMRSNGLRIVTGRTWDVVFLGQLLVQEFSTDVHFYFQKDIEFLDFSTLEELFTLEDKIRTRPDWARSIARSGHERYVQDYSDMAITQSLNFILF